MWREAARRVVRRALDEARAAGMDEAATRKHISEAYPFGERAMHPYKIWLSEVKRATAKPERVVWPWPAFDEPDSLPFQETIPDA